jgi:hypothetical protein
VLRSRGPKVLEVLRQSTALRSTVRRFRPRIRSKHFGRNCIALRRVWPTGAKSKVAYAENASAGAGAR